MTGGAFVLVAAVRLATATPNPGDELDAYDVSPGLLGFLVTFGVVGAVILLLVNMTARLRRLQHRGESGDGGVPYGDPRDDGAADHAHGHGGGSHGHDGGGSHGHDGGGSHGGDGGGGDGGGGGD